MGKSTDIKHMFTDIDVRIAFRYSAPEWMFIHRWEGKIDSITKNAKHEKHIDTLTSHLRSAVYADLKGHASTELDVRVYIHYTNVIQIDLQDFTNISANETDRLTNKLLKLIKDYPNPEEPNDHNETT